MAENFLESEAWLSNNWWQFSSWYFANFDFHFLSIYLIFLEDFPRLLNQAVSNVWKDDPGKTLIQSLFAQIWLGESGILVVQGRD